MSSEEKLQTNMRLTPTAKKLLARIADLWGISQADVVEQLLRSESARLGISKFPKIDPPYPGKPN